MLSHRKLDVRRVGTRLGANNTRGRLVRRFSRDKYWEVYKRLLQRYWQGIAERIDEKTGKITGVAILGFKKKIQRMHDVKLDLPLQLEITA